MRSVPAVRAVIGAVLWFASCDDGEFGRATADAAIDVGAPSDGGEDTAGSVTDAGVAADASVDVGNADASLDSAAAACPLTVRTGTLATLQTPGATMILKGEGLKLVGAVAISPKFLVSKSKTGKCTYGIFVADANTTFLPYSGILVLSNPVDAVSGGAVCAAGMDLIPADARPGDVVDVTGTYTEFGPSAAVCGSATPPLPAPNPGAMRQLTQLCAYAKTGVAAVPAPAIVVPTDLQSGSASLPRWEGGLVQINAVIASSGTAPGDASLGAFGIAGSTLQVVDTLYYRGAGTAPTVNSNDAFTSIVGLSSLSFCSWSLLPPTCADMKPTVGGAKCQ